MPYEIEKENSDSMTIAEKVCEPLSTLGDGVGVIWKEEVSLRSLIVKGREEETFEFKCP